MSAPSPRIGWIAAPIVLAVVATEAWLLHRFLAEPGRLRELLVLHVLLATALAMAAFGLRRSAGREPIFLLFAVLVGFLGPAGVVAVAFAALARLAFAWRARPFAEWYAALFPAEGQDRVRVLHDRIVLRGHGPAARLTVAPFADVMDLGTLEEKRAAIALMAARFQPAYAPALRAALNDTEAAVRVQAASAVGRIEQDFLSRGMALDARIAAAPGDMAAIEAAARNHEALAGSGLLDEGRARAAAEAALALRRQAMRAAAPDTRPAEHLAAAARLLLRLGRAEEAHRLLAPAMKAEDEAPALLPPYLESLFRLHRHVELRGFARALDETRLALLPDAVREALSLWRAEPMPALPGRASS